MFKHFIITRYNLGLYSTNPYKVKDPEKWMWHRWTYFKDCARSVNEQTSKNFEWIIALDPDTPKDWRQRIKQQSGATVISGQPLKHLQGIKIKQPWLITTRLDNDDRIQPEFIETIQGAFNGKTEVLDVKGVQLVESKGRYSATGREKPNSPFISLVERTKGFRTVLCETHSTLFLQSSGRIVGDKPLYIQVIHDKNIMNKPSGIWL